MDELHRIQQAPMRPPLVQNPLALADLLDEHQRSSPGRCANSTRQRMRCCCRSRSSSTGGSSQERTGAMGSGTEDCPTAGDPSPGLAQSPCRGNLAGRRQPLAASSRSLGARAAAWEGPPASGPSGTQALVGEGRAPQALRWRTSR
jgi:hypothetical protein